MVHINAKAIPTNNTNYSYSIKVVELCLTNHIGFISHYITPLVINSFRGRDTHTSHEQNQFLKTRYKPEHGLKKKSTCVICQRFIKL